MITQVVKQIENQIISQNMYYEKCIQCMEQEDESGLIEVLLDNWWQKNGMDNSVVCYNRSTPVTPIFDNYDDWKQANDSDYISVKEYSKRVQKEDFLDYVVENSDEDLSDFCSPKIARLSPSIQQHAVNCVQQDADRMFQRLYERYEKELVAHLEENYVLEDKTFD